jgi:YHS domain-containing protein
MNAKKNYVIAFSLLIGLLLTGLILITGCKKSEPEQMSPAASEMPMAAEETEHEHDMAAVAKQNTEKVSEQMEEIPKIELAVEQELCPVMGQPINKELYTEYKGKKVYFCCEGCKGKFEADPEQYLAKLPQFQEE